MRCATAVVALALALAGCGGGSEEDGARDAVREWMDALADGRGKDACGAMTAAGRREVVQLVQLFANGPREVRDCERQVPRLAGSPGSKAELDIRTVAVDGDRATVETEGGPNRVGLRREAGDWRVHSFLLDGWREFGIPDYPPGLRPPG